MSVLEEYKKYITIKENLINKISKLFDNICINNSITKLVIDDSMVYYDYNYDTLYSYSIDSNGVVTKFITNNVKESNYNIVKLVDDMIIVYLIDEDTICLYSNILKNKDYEKLLLEKTL